VDRSHLIEALAQTGRPFVAVAAGAFHTLALTEEGELYGWGSGEGNGHCHGQDVLIPHQVTTFVGQRVKHVDAGDDSSCAVTEKGDLYTWGAACLASSAAGTRNNSRRRGEWRG
jgi:alpha-tubulin suppressor-like RCC1 family protein